MKKLRICSPLNLHYHSKENVSEYIRQGLLFHKEMGFEAADFAMGLLDLASDGWQGAAERAISDSEDTGDDEVKDCSQKKHQLVFMTFGFYSQNYLCTAFPFFKKLGYKLGRILQIGVEKECTVTFSLLYGIKGVFEISEISAVKNSFYFGAGFAYIFYFFAGAV